MNMLQRLHGKVALVTGGAAGLGKAIAQRLTVEGAKVTITDIQSSVGQATATECGFDFLEQDVTDELQWDRIVQTIRDRQGGLHILVNNAGIIGPQDALTPQNTRLEDWRKIFAVNVEGVFLGCRAAIPAIHASGGGSIINISSTAGLSATPHTTAYGAAKAAVRQLTRSVAQHCLEEKLSIRCNSVHPGNTRTELWDKIAEEAARKRGVPFEQVVNESASLNPMGGFTSTADVGAAVAFLASEDSRRITGSKLVLDGGFFHCNTYYVRRLQKEMSRR